MFILGVVMGSQVSLTFFYVFLIPAIIFLITGIPAVKRLFEERGRKLAKETKISRRDMIGWGFMIKLARKYGLAKSALLLTAILAPIAFVSSFVVHIVLGYALIESISLAMLYLFLSIPIMMSAAYPIAKEAVKQDRYQKAGKFDPDDADAWNNMGVTYGKAGEYKKAIDCFQKAVELNPEYASAWHNMGSAYKGLGKHKKVTECYQKARSFTSTQKTQVEDTKFKSICGRIYTGEKLGWQGLLCLASRGYYVLSCTVGWSVCRFYSFLDLLNYDITIPRNSLGSNAGQRTRRRRTCANS